MNLKELFDKHDGEYLKFDRIANPLNPRPDMHAFLLLDTILPPNPCWDGNFRDMVDAAKHDKIYLSIDCGELEKIVTEEQVRDLARCGIGYDEETNSLYSFV